MLPLLLMIAAADAKIAINDPAKLKDDMDYAVQGEYLAELKDLGGGLKLRKGAQLVARGNKSFELKYGSLPGDSEIVKPDGIDTKLEVVKCQRDGDRVEGKIQVAETFSFGGKAPMPVIEPFTLQNEVLKVSNSKTDYYSELKRVERKSPTLGAKPPAGAIVLFDKPEDLKNWEKMNVVELSDGKFLGVGGRTKQKFQSFTLHLEFRLPWMPNSTGQARGNSGVYLQDRYELQVLDSFGLEGKDNECGGIYKESKPKVNMCFPPMTWQTYDIDFTAATFENGKKIKPAVVSVKHNGVVIHDKLELKSNTPGGGISKEVPEPGSIYLQNHGDPVVFRNIWIVEK